jgi:peptidoglycan biosynthesis protein MviN/MurJ (putative lipid II flippase)
VLAQLAERGAWPEFVRIRNARAVWSTALAGSSFLALLVVGRPVLGFFFAGSSFPPEEVHRTWGLLVVLSGVWVAGVTSQVLAGALYAQGDTETPTRVGVISFTAGVAFKVVGFYLLGIWGIAAGASLHYVLMVALLLRAGSRPRPAGAPVEPVPAFPGGPLESPEAQ